MLHDDPVAETDDHLRHPVERVQRPVDDRHHLRGEGPAVPQRRLQVGQHRLVQVAARQRLAGHRRDDRSEVGEQRRIGRAGREVESEVPGPSVTRRYRRGEPGPVGWRTYVPSRPRASMAPTSASVRQASLTVVGETPSRRDSSRTVGRRSSTGSEPAEISRPIAAAMPRRCGPRPRRRSPSARSAVRAIRRATRLCERGVTHCSVTIQPLSSPRCVTYSALTRPGAGPRRTRGVRR